MKGKRIAITSGPTRAAIDAVRFISNRSTGGLGVALAEECLRQGAEVTFYRGAGSLLPVRRPALKIIEIETVDDLTRSLKTTLKRDRHDVFFHAMAVLDYVPAREFKGKIKSVKESLTLRLVRTPKVINLIRELSPDTILVAFKLEVSATKAQLSEAAKNLMRASNADFVFANDLRSVEKGSHSGYLLHRNGQFLGPFKGKETIAKALVAAVTDTLIGES
ncbi:MAG: phosphopantothenoylcysteine decarboxylase [bacterium]|nr:phosphopantothenoylcysteine decarboxylase [bacterium]